MGKERALGYQFRTISNLINRHTDAAMSERNIENLTGVQGWVTRYLLSTKKKQVFQKDIEEDLAMKSSTASRVLKLMEKNGYITREGVESDGRLKQVIPTQKMRDMSSFIVEELINLEWRMREGISEQEMDKFFITLEKIKENLI